MGDGMPLNLLELTQEQGPMVWPLMVVIRGAVQFSSRVRGGGGHSISGRNGRKDSAQSS